MPPLPYIVDLPNLFKNFPNDLLDPTITALLFHPGSLFQRTDVQPNLYTFHITLINLGLSNGRGPE